MDQRHSARPGTWLANRLASLNQDSPAAASTPTTNAPPDSWRTFKGAGASSSWETPIQLDADYSEEDYDATVDQTWGVGRLKREEPEDDEMGDSGDMSDSSSSPATVEAEESDHEESEGVPLKADSPWINTTPEREEILRLRKLWAAKDLPPYGALPSPTARDVAFTAFSSVKFLRDLLKPSINKSDIGIDHAGRLFDLSFGNKNFHKDFDDMVMEIRRDSQAQPSRKKIEKTLKEYIDVDGMALQMKGIYHGGDAYRSLLDCATAVVEAQRFEIRDLRRVRAKCAKLTEEMSKVISITKAVALDLKDSGSTTSKRWNALVRMENKPSTVASVVVGNQTPRRGHRRIIQVLETFMRPYQKFLGRTLHLDDCLETAIEVLELPVNGYED